MLERATRLSLDKEADLAILAMCVKKDSDLAVVTVLLGLGWWDLGMMVEGWKSHVMEQICGPKEGG